MFRFPHCHFQYLVLYIGLQFLIHGLGMLVPHDPVVNRIELELDYS